MFREKTQHLGGCEGPNDENGMLGRHAWRWILFSPAPPSCKSPAPGVPGGIKERIPLQAKNQGQLKKKTLYINLRDFFPDPFLVRYAPRTNHASSWWSPLRNHTWQRWMQGTLRKRDNLRFERIPLNGFYDPEGASTQFHKLCILHLRLHKVFKGSIGLRANSEAKIYVNASDIFWPDLPIHARRIHLHMSRLTFYFTVAPRRVPYQPIKPSGSTTPSSPAPKCLNQNSHLHSPC